ncbi:hypothetical protein GTQ34_16110 [Muricauda sp. JGD-17]|uniref:Lipocalin-like domain-containing protein n=1 Tax=Flagellimonas ochracea TaxID=2696472 RepID=A0A964TG08_9FLAO|nr:hypothetical protein [Allomuricauda ochracea]NAY93436.1 hypothetical protein [Allomuricauda ochracea]
MKNLILHICVLFSIAAFSQEKSADEITKQVKIDLIGYWEKSPAGQDGEKYLVQKQDDLLYLNIGKFQNGKLEFVVSDKIRLEVVQGKTIKLKNFHLENNGISELIFLDSTKLILKNGNTLSEYKKFK